MGAFYQLDRKTVLVSGLCLLAGGCLIFVAGIVVGLSLGRPPSLAAVPEGSAPPSGPALATVATEPPSPPLDEIDPAMDPARATAPRREPAAAAPPAAAEPAPEAVPETAPPGQDQLAAQDPLDPQHPLAGENPEAGDGETMDEPPSAFSLQLGAYLMPENLEQALVDLEKKGLEGRVVEVTDSRGTVLSSVRVGHYANRFEAEQAAAELRRRQRLEVLIKRELAV